MTPKIDSGDEVTVKKFPATAMRVGDIVYAKVNGNCYLHLISAIDVPLNRYQISNNHGHVNGWTSEVYGLCVKVKDTVIVSEEEQLRRLIFIHKVTHKVI